MENGNADNVLAILKQEGKTTIRHLSSKTGLDTKTVMNCLEYLRNKKVVISLECVADGFVLAEVMEN